MKICPALYNQLGIFLPLSWVNCAIMEHPCSCREDMLTLERQRLSVWVQVSVDARHRGYCRIREKLKYSNISPPA
ncbi:MAG: Rnf-Nqr domain containing protein [Butyricimonas paravirosa]